MLGLQFPRLCTERVSLSMGRGVSRSPLSLVLCDGVVFHVCISRGNTRDVFQRDVQTGGTSLYHPREAGGCPDVMNEGIPSYRI